MFSSLSLRRLASVPSALFLSSLLFFEKAFAGFGGNVPGDLPGGANITQVVVNFLNIVLNLLGLIIAVIIVIAGIRLIFSQGEEEAKESAKKTILYAVIGLIVVLLAKAVTILLLGAAIS